MRGIHRSLRCMPVFDLLNLMVAVVTANLAIHFLGKLREIFFMVGDTSGIVAV